jgi:hypothetical protein
MPVRSDDPLRRVTLNLYEADVIWFIRTYGPGWTERLRQHIHSVVHEHRPPASFHEYLNLPRPRTLGDLDHDT